jgi:hypothetical protein
VPRPHSVTRDGTDEEKEAGQGWTRLDKAGPPSGYGASRLVQMPHPVNRPGTDRILPSHNPWWGSVALCCSRQTRSRPGLAFQGMKNGTRGDSPLSAAARGWRRSCRPRLLSSRCGRSRRVRWYSGRRSRSCRRRACGPVRRRGRGSPSGRWLRERRRAARSRAAAALCTSCGSPYGARSRGPVSTYTWIQANPSASSMMLTSVPSPSCRTALRGSPPASSAALTVPPPSISRPHLKKPHHSLPPIRGRRATLRRPPPGRHLTRHTRAPQLPPPPAAPTGL